MRDKNENCEPLKPEKQEPNIQGRVRLSLVNNWAYIKQNNCVFYIGVCVMGIDLFSVYLDHSPISAMITVLGFGLGLEVWQWEGLPWK